MLLLLSLQQEEQQVQNDSMYWIVYWIISRPRALLYGTYIHTCVRALYVVARKGQGRCATGSWMEGMSG